MTYDKPYGNRLHLDFSLQYNDERSAFLRTYLNDPQFIAKPPTLDELETMSNYVLWGKDRKTGLNIKQSGDALIATKSADWAQNERVESLEALFETPLFNEITLSPLSAPQIKIKRENFSREDALRDCPHHLYTTFTNLFRQIDTLALTIEFYEADHGRREEVRPEMLAKFTPEEQSECADSASRWTQRMYLRQRHQLIELRRTQYTLRDSYAAPLKSSPDEPQLPINPPSFDCEIGVWPLGVINNTDLARWIFQDIGQLNPLDLRPSSIKQISDFYWAKQHTHPGANQFWIDFRELEHVYNLIGRLDDFAPDSELRRTLDFYIEQSNLDAELRDLLDLRFAHKSSQTIADIINAKYHRTHTPNYISTIFRQRIIPRINEAAIQHEQIVANIAFPEEFKTCTRCGRTLLRTNANFMRKAVSPDGYATRCKRCAKEVRLQK